MRRTKPRICKLDRGHLLARGLTLDVPLDERGGARARDLINRSATAFTTAANAPVWGVGRYGPLLVLPTTSAQVSGYPTGARLLPTTAGTLLTRIRPTGSAPVVANVFLGAHFAGDGPNQFWGLYQANISSVDALWAYVWTGGERRVSVAYTSGAWMDLAWVFGGGSLALYANGVLAGTAAAPGAINSLASAFRLGNAGGGATGDLAYARVYNRALPAWAVRLAAADPWLLYRRVRYRDLLVTAAAHTFLAALHETISLTDTRSASVTKALLESLALTDARSFAVVKALVETLDVSDDAVARLLKALRLTDRSASGDGGTRGGGIA
jgi:hypothetical protein